MYSDKLQHYSTGRGEQLKWEKQTGETLPSLHPARAPLLPFQGGLGGGGAPVADGQDHRVGGEMSTRVCQGVGEGRCSTGGGKRRVPGGIWGMMMDLGGCLGQGGCRGQGMGRGCCEDSQRRKGRREVVFRGRMSS